LLGTHSHFITPDRGSSSIREDAFSRIPYYTCAQSLDEQNTVSPYKRNTSRRCDAFSSAVVSVSHSPTGTSCGDTLTTSSTQLCRRSPSTPTNSRIPCWGPEDLTHIQENMDYGAFMNRRLHGWGFANLHAQIRYKTAENGIRVETVDPAYTSKTCHCWGEQGYRPKQATFKYSTPECWVSEYQADVNAGPISQTATSAERVTQENTRMAMTRLSTGTFDRPAKQPRRY
jgi:Putative transposase DNA-binding domain